MNSPLHLRLRTQVGPVNYSTHSPECPCATDRGPIGDTAVAYSLCKGSCDRIPHWLPPLAVPARLNMPPSVPAGNVPERVHSGEHANSNGPLMRAWLPPLPVPARLNMPPLCALARVLNTPGQGQAVASHVPERVYSGEHADSNGPLTSAWPPPYLQGLWRHPLRRGPAL